MSDNQQTTEQEVSTGKELAISKLSILLDKAGLEKDQKTALFQRYKDAADKVEQWQKYSLTMKVKDENDTQGMAYARSGVSVMKDVIKGIEKTRKELKKRPLNEGRAIDDAANLFKGLATPLLEHFQAEADYAFRKNEERITEIIKERAEVLKPFGVDTRLFDLGGMTKESWERCLVKVQTEFNQKKREARIEVVRKWQEDRKQKAEKKKLQDRLAELELERQEQEEQDRIKNGRIKDMQLLGYSYDPEYYELKYKDQLTFGLHQFFPMPDNKYADFMEYAESNINYVRSEEEKEKEKIQVEELARKQLSDSRIQMLIDIGYKYDVRLNQISYENAVSEKTDFGIMQEESWNEYYIKAITYINQKTEQEKESIEKIRKEKEAEEKQLAIDKENKRLAKEKKKLDAAPDKEKLILFCKKMFDDISYPVLKTKEAQDIMNAVKEKLDSAWGILLNGVNSFDQKIEKE